MRDLVDQHVIDARTDASAFRLSRVGPVAVTWCFRHGSLTALAMLSDASQISIPQFYRKSEETLARAQRGWKTPNRIRKSNAKIAT